MTVEIDHLGLSVSDYERSRAFYLAALKPLGVGIVMEFPEGAIGPFASAGLGAEGKPVFWISTGEKTAPRLHIAFRAETRDQVDEFYAAAMEAGGTDNGQPGLRLHYHANYYGAFVLDPDGHNIEVVCHYSLAELNAAAHAAAAPRARKRAKKAVKKAAAVVRKVARDVAGKVTGKKAAKKKAPARKAAGKKTAKKSVAKQSAAKKAAKKPAKKASAKKKVVRKPVGRGRKTRR